MYSRGKGLTCAQYTPLPAVWTLAHFESSKWAQNDPQRLKRGILTARLRVYDIDFDVDFHILILVYSRGKVLRYTKYERLTPSRLDSHSF